MISVTKKFTFDAGHRLSNYDGKCRHLHGHTYKCEITVACKVLDNKGMVIDFGDLKKIYNETVDAKFDHKMILQTGDPINQKIGKALEGFKSQFNSIVWVTYNPTAEKMAKDIFEMVNNKIQKIGRGLGVTKVVLYETPNSKASCSV